MYDSQTSYYVQAKETNGWHNLVEPGFATLEQTRQEIKDWPSLYHEKQLRIVKETITHDIIPYAPEVGVE